MNSYRVLTLLCEIAGIEAKDAEKYLPVCDACSRKIEKRLLETADENDERLIYAAAALANYQVALLRASENDAGYEKISVGDISVSGSNEQCVKNAKLLCDEAMDCICDLVSGEQAFFFRGV